LLYKELYYDLEWAGLRVALDVCQYRK